MTPAMQVAIDHVRFYPDDYRSGFDQWLADNWEIFDHFCREADRMWVRHARRHYSARTIVEHLRHWSATREKGGEYKINDWWTPHMARLYIAMNPGREGFFELREKKAA